LSGSNATFTSGSVGIGTTSPGYPLHVQTSNARAGYIYSSLTSGPSFGLFGRSDSSSGVGTVGYATATSGQAIGVQGQSDSPTGRGILGWAAATTGDAWGVWGYTTSNAGTGVVGHAAAASGVTTGVLGRVDSPTDEATAVYGGAWAQTGLTTGVWGVTSSSADGAAGVYGTSTATTGQNFGVFGSAESPEGFGVYSLGNMGASGTKQFVIDHPLDPDNKYLHHYASEGPVPLNIYNGRTLLDSSGEAWVGLPDYFEAINKDCTYHLTPIGNPAPTLYVAQREPGRFKIAGGQAGLEVAWIVMASRNDAWVRTFGAPVETVKSERERGRLLHPQFASRPAEQGLFFRKRTKGPEVAEAAPVQASAE
jgi:hypothetical protein